MLKEDKRQEKITELNLCDYTEMEFEHSIINTYESYHLIVYSEAKIPPNVSGVLRKGSRESKKSLNYLIK